MKETVPIIVGSTAVGKTKLSLLLAEKLDLEIISADSRQIYRYLNIGTAKAEPEIRSRIPHHLIDICDPDEYFSAGMFARYARKIIKEIQERNKIPLVVGGSGLYIKALVDGFFDGDIKDIKIRKELEDSLQDKGLNSLYEQLQTADPIYAARISFNDRQRILRGLEVCLITGKPFSEWIKKEKQSASFLPKMFGLRMVRAKLYQRINARVEAMLKAGLIDEVRALLEKGYSSKLNALNTVGYKETLLYLDKQIDYNEMVERIKKNSRHYAKRQMTWFKKDKRILWFEIETDEDLRSVSKQIIRFLKD